jgi:hypothetical protein
MGRGGGRKEETKGFFAAAAMPQVHDQEKGAAVSIFKANKGLAAVLGSGHQARQRAPRQETAKRRVPGGQFPRTAAIAQVPGGVRVYR